MRIQHLRRIRANNWVMIGMQALMKIESQVSQGPTVTTRRRTKIRLTKLTRRAGLSIT